MSDTLYPPTKNWNNEFGIYWNRDTEEYFIAHSLYDITGNSPQEVFEKLGKQLNKEIQDNE